MEPGVTLVTTKHKLTSIDCQAFAKYFWFIEDFKFAVLIPEEKLATWVNIFLRYPADDLGYHFKGQIRGFRMIYKVPIWWDGALPKVRVEHDLRFSTTA